MKITKKNGSDFRPADGDYVTTTLLELSPSQKLKRIPSNVMFLIDASSSMGGDKWRMVKQAAKEMVDSLGNDDRVGLVLFDTSAREVFPLASLSQNRATMSQAIDKLDNPSGVTNLEEGLKLAFDAFDKRSSGDKMNRVNHVILLTDGFPTDNQGYRVDSTHKYESYVRMQEHVTLTGVGIGSAEDYDSDFISKLSDLGSGSYYHANNLEKFREGLQAEMAKLQSSVVGSLILKFNDVEGKIMRIAKVSPEIVIYDIPGNKTQFELKTGSMTKDSTSFLVQTSSQGGEPGSEVPLFKVAANYDGNVSDELAICIKNSDKESDFGQVDPDVMRSMQMLQVNLNGEKIQASLKSGDKETATRLIQNTTRIASSLGQDKVTKALTRLATDVKRGKSASDELATIKDESKKTRLLM